MFIQNTSVQIASTVTVAFHNGGSTTTRTFSVAPSGSLVVDPTNDGISGLFVGSATVTGTQPVAVTLNQSNGLILFSSTGSGTGGSTLLAPLLMTGNHGWSTGFQVQNASATQTTTISLFFFTGEQIQNVGACDTTVDLTIEWYTSLQSRRWILAPVNRRRSSCD